MQKQKTTTSIKRPRFVLTDMTRFYLATKELSEQSPDGLFFIVSLFLPKLKNGILELHTEVATFDDAESALIYRETVAAMAATNVKTVQATMFKEQINNFIKAK